MFILIGSRALSHWHPEHEVPEKSDWDIVTTHTIARMLVGSQSDPDAFSWQYIAEDVDGNTIAKIEFHNSKYFLNHELVKYATEDKIEVVDGFAVNVCSSRGLAVIKRSHLYRPHDFAKHIIQYQYLDRDFSPEDWEFINARYELTKAEFPDRVGSKDQTNEEFFKDAIVKHLPHDQIHDIVAHYGRPIFYSLKRDQTKANYEDDLFEALSLEDKHKVIMEEAYVIAIERWLVPYALEGRKFPYRMAYYKAIEKCCTTLDAGLFRKHATDYWSEVVKFDESMFDKFFNSNLWRNYNAT